MIAGGSNVQKLFPAGEALHVLTLTPFYPVAGDDAQGCFVAEPLSWLAQLGVTNTVRVAQPFYRRGAVSHDSAVPDSVVPAQWVRFFSGRFFSPAFCLKSGACTVCIRWT